MADNPSTPQRPEIEDVIMEDASMLSAEIARQHSHHAAFHQMDTASLLQRDNQNLKVSPSIGPGFARNPLPPFSISSLHPPPAPPLPKLGSRAPPVRAPYIRPLMRFSPKGSPRPPSTTTLALSDPHLWPRRRSNRYGETEYSGFWKRRLHPDLPYTPFGPASTNAAPTRDSSSFSSIESQKSTEDGKANSFDSFTSISTTQSSLSRKRSVDQTEDDRSHHTTPAAGNVLSPKYRRVSEEGWSVPSGPCEDLRTPSASQPETLPQLDTLPSPCQSSSQPTQQTQPTTSFNALGPSTNYESPAASNQQTQSNGNPEVHMPGCWPRTPHGTPYQRHDANAQVELPMMSGALLPPESDSSHVSTVPQLAGSEESNSPGIADDLPGNVGTNPNHQPNSTWRGYCISLYDSIQPMYAIHHVSQTFTTAVKGALALADSVKQQALRLWDRRRHSARRSPTPAGQSPVRANIRALSPEQRRRLKSNQWRKDRGQPVLEEFPFPEISFDMPQSPQVSEAVNQLSGQSGQATITTEPTNKRARLSRDSTNRRVSSQGKKRHKPSTSGVRKVMASRVRPLNPQLSATLQRLKRRDPRRRALESAVYEAIRTGDYSHFREIRHTGDPFHRSALHPTEVNQASPSQRIARPQETSHTLVPVPEEVDQANTLKSSLSPQETIHPLVSVSKEENQTNILQEISPKQEAIRPSVTASEIGTGVISLEDGEQSSIRPKQKPRVRFQEPLVNEPRREPRSEIVTELAPHLRPCPANVERPAVVEEPFVEQKENIPPVAVTVVETTAEIVDHEVSFLEQPSVDPWLQPAEFPLGRPVSAVSLFYPTPKPLPPGRTESIYAEEWRKIEEEQKLKQRPTRIRPEGRAVRPLPPKWESRVAEAMRLPNSRKIATTLSGDPLTRKDLATCFTPMAWLNDEVINAYLALIIDYLRRAHGNAGRHDKPRFHAFNSFFFSNLRDKGYESVRRWASRAKIGGEALLDVDTVFVPVHNSAHWTLIVVKPSQRTIEHFDSLGSLSRRHVGIVKTWLRSELGPRYIEEEWTVLPSVSPQQDNGSDCGVFLLSTAKAVAIDIEPLSYGARDTSLLRKKIVAELMNGGLEGDFSPAGENGVVLL